MSSYTSIYYFMIGNINNNRQEIGNYFDSNLSDNNFDNVKFTCNDILKNLSKDVNENKKNKIVLDNFLIFYILKISGTFYLAVVFKNSIYGKKENLIFEFFEDIDHQGIKKLVDSNGVLTHVGMQNLKFCIDVFEENVRKKNINKNDDDNIENKDKEKISLLNNKIDDIHLHIKEDNINNRKNSNDFKFSSNDNDGKYILKGDKIDGQNNLKKLIFKLGLYFILVFILILILILFLL